jgi:pimeloyl-ACP methyl ester carboxylesterase
MIGTDLATELGVRLIGVDRPGFGFSDPDPSRTIETWPSVIEQLADMLGLDRFSVLGVSAGARCALACSWSLRDRVIKTGAVCPVLPPEYYEGDPLVELVASDRRTAEIAMHEKFAAMASDLPTAVAAMAERAGQDAAIYASPAVASLFTDAWHEAFRQGVDGAVLDVLLGNLPWGFALSEIDAEILIWHGTADPVTPMEVLNRAIEEMPSPIVMLYEGEGHAIGFPHAAEIVTAMR